MSIDFSCPCGERLQAPEALARRQVRCPACGKPVVVPQSTVPPPAARAEPEEGPLATIFGIDVSRRSLVVIAVVLALMLGIGLWVAARPSASSATAKGPAPPAGSGGGYVDALIRARHKGRSTAAGMEMSQIGYALRMYQMDHGDAWPDTLGKLRPYLGSFDRLMRDPRTGKPNRFIYAQPDRVTSPSSTPVLYEGLDGKPNPEGAVLYADGTVRIGAAAPTGIPPAATGAPVAPTGGDQ